MPDEDVNAPAATADAPPAVATEQEIQNQIGMALAFDDPSMMPKTDDVNVPAADNNIPAADPNTTEPIAVIQPTTDYTPFIKETFGVESIDEAKEQWRELQALKANPPKPSEFKFADAQSEKIAHLINEGKIKELSQWAQAQELLAGADTMGNEEKLKLYIKMQNPRFDKELIEDEYTSLYSINEDDYIDDPMKLRKEKLRLEQRIENDVVKAQEYFSTYTQKIQLPEIQPQAVTVDADYEAYKASNAAVSEKINNVLIPAINALKESDVQFNFKVDDANNQMQFDVALVPTKEDFEKAKQDSLNFDNFLNRTFYDKDGKFLPQNVQRMILLYDNFDKYAQSSARQAVNEERKRVIAKEAPNGNGSRDYNVNGEMSELQKQMNFALS